MRFSAASQSGDPSKPNEDWFAVTSDLVVVLDGATVRTETGCDHGAAWYARKLGAGIITRGADQSRALPDVLAAAISDVAQLHPECDLRHPGTPSAGAAILRISERSFTYAILGDVTIAVDGPSRIWQVSDDRVSRTAPTERREADRWPIGSAQKNRAMVRMKRAELAARNVEGGYWIAAADPSVTDQCITGEFPATDVSRMAVLTDGAARYVDAVDLGTWQEAMRTLSDDGPCALIDRVRQAERSDPDGRRRARNMCSDDATAVVGVA